MPPRKPGNGKKDEKRMRRIKPALCALMTLFLLLSLCACGGASPEQRLAAAAERLERAGSLSYAVDMDMRLGAEGRSRETKLASRVSVSSEPAAVYYESVTAVDDAYFSEYTVCAVPAGERYCAYINLNGEWARQELSAEELASYDLRSNIGLWTSGLSSVTVGGSELIDGRRATRYDCVVGPEGVDAIMAGSGAYAALPVLGLSRERATEVLSGLGELSYSVWIDDRLGLPLRYDIDMTDIMDQFLQNIAPAALSDVAVSVERLTVCLSLSDYDAVEPIELPPEALGAKQVDDVNELWRELP